MKMLIVLSVFLLIGCDTTVPVSDKTVEAMVKHCETIGKEAYVFNGIVSYVRCEEK